MLKLTSVFLIVTMFLAVTMPAQTLSVSSNPNERQADLRQTFSLETEKLRNESAVIDAKKMEKARRQVPKKSWTKEDKKLAIILGVTLAVVLFLVIKYGKNCIKYENDCSPADEGCYCEQYEEKD